MFGPLNDALTPDPSQNVPASGGGGTVGMGIGDAFQAAATQVLGQQQPVAQPAAPQNPPAAAAQPQQQQASPPSPRPILLDLISGLVHPAAQNLNAARPGSRVDVLERFLGNFIGALGQGFSNAGRGPGANFRGAGAAMGAPYQQSLQQYQLGQQAQANQADVAQRQAQTQLTQQQAAFLPTQQAAQVASMTAQPRFDPATSQFVGNMTDKQFETYVKGQGAAQVSAKARLTSDVFRAQLQAGQVGHIADYRDQSGKYLGQMAYDKMGKPIGLLDGAFDPKMFPEITTTQALVPDGAGGVLIVPKTTVSGKAQPSAAPDTSSGLSQLGQKVPGLQGAAAKQTLGQRVPALGAAQNSPRRIMTNAVGVAFDPVQGGYVQETAAEAQAAGHQQFQKITLKESEENRQLNNRLTDVAQKITNYQDSLNRPITLDDQIKLAALLGEDKWKAEAFGTSIPIDWFNKQMDAAKLNGLSGNAVQRMFAYYNARESMVGYQRVLSGGSKSNEKAMQLNLDALPNPLLDPRVANEGLRQFTQNLEVAGQGLPRMKGITSAADILGARSSRQRQTSGTVPNAVQVLGDLGLNQ